MTDNNGVSRRDAIALAGVGAAGLALAGCSAGAGSGGPQLSVQEVSDRVSAFITERGLDNHGDNPNEPPASPIAFTPQFMAIIHIKSDGPWSISSNHAHFSYAEQDTTRRTEHARDILLQKLSGPNGRFRDPRNHARFPVHNRKPPTDPQPDLADELDFSTFQFGSQHDIYVFYEHGPNEISFDDKNNRYLTFSKFFKDGTAANRNHAFFNAERITEPQVLGELKGKGSLIRLENHMTYKLPIDPLATEPAQGEQYKEIPIGTQNHHRYKMNLIYITRSGLVMMIDPDTGNGVGYDPLIGA
jgi:hypothetical protein